MTTQTKLSNNSKRYKSVGIAILIVTFLIISLLGGLYLNGNSSTQTPLQTPTPTPIPFDYNLTISQTNNTIMQGNSAQINAIITHMQGSPENITLSAIGVPNGTYYTFSKLQESPANSSTSTSTLTIHVSQSTPTNSYNITINSTSENGKTHSSQYTLSVLNSEFTISGTINGGNKVPTQIIFEQLSTTGATVQTFTATVTSGQYTITLPNNQWYYAVSINWITPDGQSGTHHYLFPRSYGVGVGITSKMEPFTIW